MVTLFSEMDLVSTYPFSCAKQHVLIDVGAHQGSSSEPFALKGWKILAFEPEQKNHHAFLRNLAGFPDVLCIQKAVSDVSGAIVPFYVSKEHYGIHSLKPFHDTHELSCEVETVRLDTALEQYAIPTVTVLKIDIEGADFFALQSFNFDNYKPELVVVEFMDDRSVPNYGYSHHEMVRFMEGHGYTAFVSEWALIKEYGREGVQGDPHTWLRCRPYPLDHEPAWGNLIFMPEAAKEKFSITLDQYLIALKKPQPNAFGRFLKRTLGCMRTLEFGLNKGKE